MTEGAGPESSELFRSAHRFALSVYGFSDYFPQKEVGGLTVQLRRAAMSVSVNVAAGLRKAGSAEGARHVSDARDRLEECRYYLILARDLGYGDNPELMPQLEEVSRLLGEYVAATGS